MKKTNILFISTTDAGRKVSTSRPGARAVCGAPRITGIQHLNFSQHGPKNKAQTEFQKLAPKPAETQKSFFPPPTYLTHKL